MSAHTRARLTSAFVLFGLTFVGGVYVSAIIVGCLVSFAQSSVGPLAAIFVALCGLLPVFNRVLDWLSNLDRWALEVIEAEAKAVAVVASQPAGEAVVVTSSFSGAVELDSASQHGGR